MAQIINTNISSLNAQRNLNTSQSSLATSLQRLSSGLRINSAKDDAAGLAISERFTTQIRGLNQAIRNASDGISLSQTAEGSLNEVVNNLQRIRELAVQSANATNSSSDRAALDAEVQQRLAEIERVAVQTSFNGRTILDGSFGNAQFQVGANVGQTININLSTGVRTSQIGSIAEKTGTAVTAAALTANGVTIQVGTAAAQNVGASVAGTGAGQTDYSAYAKAQAINAAGISGLTATATNSVADGGVFSAVSLDAAAENYNLVINGETIINQTWTAGTETITAQNVVDATNLNSNVTGVSATLNAGVVSFSTIDGRNIDITETLTGTVAGTGLASNTGTLVQTRGTITLSAADSIKLTGTEELLIGFADNETIAKDTGALSSVNVNTVTASENTIKRIDSALTAVSSLRSTFGAIQNRFESVIANLETTAENLTASRSRIQDADFAAETANLTRAQILQQAGITILSQANAQPQNVLALLQ